MGRNGAIWRSNAGWPSPAARKTEREFFDFFRTVRYTWHYSEIRFHTLFLRSSSVANRKMKIEYFSLLSVQFSLSMNVYYVRKEKNVYQTARIKNARTTHEACVQHSSSVLNLTQRNRSEKQQHCPKYNKKNAEFLLQRIISRDQVHWIQPSEHGKRRMRVCGVESASVTRPISASRLLLHARDDSVYCVWREISQSIG